MKAPTRLLAPVLAASVAACAALTPERPSEQNAQLRLDRGISALQSGMYPEGFDDLVWVYTRCAGHEAGVHALTALAAIELDPRNRAARPALGTEILAQVLQDSTSPQWMLPLMETSFLAALALGAPHPDEHAELVEDEPALLHDHAADAHPALETPVPAGEAGEGATAQMDAAYGCGRALEPTGWVAADLPTLPGPSMAELLANATARRENAVARNDTLQAELTALRAELQATRDELERIRKTLKP